MQTLTPSQGISLDARAGSIAIRLSPLTLVFAALSVTFFLLLIFLRIPSPLYPLMSIQDTVDILTPLVLIPVYWMMFKGLTQNKAGLAGEIFFMVMSAFWVAGQGMHLSANSINNLIENLAKEHVIDIARTDIYRLTYFYDEHLSHYLLHIGVLGLAALLIYEGWKQSSEDKTDWRIVIPAGVLYGFTYFCIFLEGQTWPMGLPFAVFAALWIAIWGRRKFIQQPVLAFFLVASVFASALLIGWGLYWGGFPQFSDVGLI